ncbi:CarD family transcriptional regulator [Roseomonas sp. SG15]|uniref:CarD family transcriptional regulator n=2 Tax=Roseomonas indoligenes TaxID=2820811 RepID=A0A940MQF9_9PROT|nr:CarD family transcriptional regulator [Pararoseomonas indoligenes]
MAEAQAPAPSMTSSTAPEPVIQAPIRPAPPPKPLGNAGKDFKAGDHVVYPTHGVGQVQGIEEVPVAGHTLKVIVVTFEENRMTLKVPMAKAASSGLRKLASEKVMGEAMDTLKGRARIKRTMWSRRAQEYEQKINSGDPIAIAEVVRDLHRNAGQPDQSFSERQIYELALDRLAAEVAAMDRTDKVVATQKLLDHLKTAEKGEKPEKGEKEK